MLAADDSPQQRCSQNENARNHADAGRGGHLCYESLSGLHYGSLSGLHCCRIHEKRDYDARLYWMGSYSGWLALSDLGYPTPSPTHQWNHQLTLGLKGRSEDLRT